MRWNLGVVAVRGEQGVQSAGPVGGYGAVGAFNGTEAVEHRQVVVASAPKGSHMTSSSQHAMAPRFGT